MIEYLDYVQSNKILCVQSKKVFSILLMLMEANVELEFDYKGHATYYDSFKSIYSIPHDSHFANGGK